MSAHVLAHPFQLPPRRGLLRRTRRVRERVVAIGDIHGRWDLLQILVRGVEKHLSEREREQTVLVVLGDFIDRGPSSRHVVDFLRAAQARSENIVVLLGNHEAALLGAVAGDPQAQQLWLAYGGDATLESYDIAPPAEGESSYAFGARIAAGIGIDVIDWMRELPLTWRSGDFLFCHAGVRPGRAIAKQLEEDLLWIRDEFLDDERDHGAVVVHGHSIVDRADIRHNRISVDTGAYFSNILSAVVLSEEGHWILSTEPEGGAQGAAQPDAAL